MLRGTHSTISNGLREGEWVDDATDDLLSGEEAGDCVWKSFRGDSMVRVFFSEIVSCLFVLVVVRYFWFRISFRSDFN